ncbi:MAG: DUF2239 family protein [bacterium]
MMRKINHEETMDEITHSYTLFAGHRQLAHGALNAVVLRARKAMEEGKQERFALYDDATGRRLDVDLHGSEEDVIARLAEHPQVPKEVSSTLQKSGPGRPRLGVVSREVSLLPRHWEWLSTQRGGASATIRRLVDEARRNENGRDIIRRTQEAVDRFLWDMAGDFPHFEEVTRALYARDLPRLTTLIEEWPDDVRDYVLGRVAGLANAE